MATRLRSVSDSKSLLTHLRLERRAVEAERADHVAAIQASQSAIDELDRRLREIDQAEGLVG